MKNEKTILDDQEFELDELEIEELDTEEKEIEFEDLDCDLNFLDENLEMEDKEDQSKKQEFGDLDESLELDDLYSFDEVDEQEVEVITKTKEDEKPKEIVEGYDLSNAKPAEAESSERSLPGGRKGVANIVKSSNGNRFGLSNEIGEHLGSPDKVQILFSEDIIIATTGLEDITEYSLRKQGNKFFIYNTALVNEMTDIFELDFSKGKTSITFYNGELTSDTNGNPIAIINID